MLHNPSGFSQTTHTESTKNMLFLNRFCRNVKQQFIHNCRPFQLYPSVQRTRVLYRVPQSRYQGTRVQDVQCSEQYWLYVLNFDGLSTSSGPQNHGIREKVEIISAIKSGTSKDRFFHNISGSDRKYARAYFGQHGSNSKRKATAGKRVNNKRNSSVLQSNNKNYSELDFSIQIDGSPLLTAHSPYPEILNRKVSEEKQGVKS